MFWCVPVRCSSETKGKEVVSNVSKFSDSICLFNLKNSHNPPLRSHLHIINTEYILVNDILTLLFSVLNSLDQVSETTVFSKVSNRRYEAQSGVL